MIYLRYVRDDDDDYDCDCKTGKYTDWQGLKMYYNCPY